MSHELRTPLNAIIGFSEIMKDQVLGPIGNAKYSEYSSDIFNSGNYLLEIINDILDLSKIEAGKLEHIDSDIQVADLIDHVVMTFKNRLRESKITLTINIPLQNIILVADRLQVMQVLVNLVSNAVKFTPEQGQIWIRVKNLGAQGLAIAVEDTGIGIPKQYMETILEPFAQVESSYHKRYEGTGLGLTLVNSIVSGHGGTLEIESELNEGTTVTVTFPANRVDVES